MLRILLVLLVLAESSIASADAIPPKPAPATAETTSTTPRVVREFPPIEVRALLPDMRSSQSTHLVPGTVLHTFPVDNLVDAIALQPGVVAQGDELHVRGGRSGETAVSLDGLSLNEPLRRRAIDVPLLALRSAELVSGAPEAQFGGALSGVLNLRTVDPGERPSAEWRWQSDGGLDTHYDRIAARAGTPLPVLGLGVVTAGEAMLDDTWLPALRSENRKRILGLSWGWRAENRMLGFLKLAPVRQPERFTAQVLVGRQVHQPYSPSFSLDGWVYVPQNLKSSPIFSPTPQPGYLRYRSADHLAITDDRQIAALLKVSTLEAAKRASLSLGWLRTRSVTSVGGQPEPESASHRPRYGNAGDRDWFVVQWGDYPLYRESASDVLTLRGDGEIVTRTGGVKAGAALTYEQVRMREMDWMPFFPRVGDDIVVVPLDSIRAYRAGAPGGFAYVQGRWASGGLVLNTGLRAEYFTAGPEATHQTLPGSTSGVWSFAPRLGIAYPISTRDAFSLAYVRIHQSPGRDFLYDQRTAISTRQPLGNPALRPATLVSYEASVKHLFGPALALQVSVFFRDVIGQVGALDFEVPQGPINLRYIDSDDSQTHGLEWSLIHDNGTRRIEVSYGWMEATGNESRPEGDPYGPLRSARVPTIADLPVSWDRRQTMLVSGAGRLREHWSLAWSTALMSPLPWTPKLRRAPITDFGSINSRRLEWSENTNVNVQWSPAHAWGLVLGLEARNLFNNRSEKVATLDGYPNPAINTLYDDYGAYRTETGQQGGGYWSNNTGQWVPVHDPRLYNPPRAVRASVGARW